MSLDAEALQAIAKRIASDRQSWEQHVDHDATERTFHRLRLDDDLEVWMIRWQPGSDTGFHDHDGSAGAVTVVQGAVIEERLVVRDEPDATVNSAGDTFYFSPLDIHRVRHAGDGPAITIHAYSPPLGRVGSYVIEADGRIARYAMDQDEELRQLAA
ncbi:MAG TPA: cysteine dioxygenase family protein [Baekduia sp.]|nr:cysteine dioxygenase family protein [Baekduia sp.]